MTFRTRAAALTGSVLLAAGLGLTAAAPAQAADCGGSLVGLKPMKVSGTTVGELAIYYNAGSGQNCARFNHRGPSVGETRLTTVTIQACAERTRSYTCTRRGDADVDKDNYAYYAGPVYADGSRCIQADGYMMWGGSYRHVDTGGAAYCG